MLNLHELESRWMKYKIKSMIPVSILTLFFLIITYIIYSYIITDNTFEEKVNKTSKQKEIKKVLIQNESIKKIEPIVTNNIHSTNKTTQQIPKSKTLMEPSMDFIKNIQMESPDYYEDKEPQNIKKQTIFKKKEAPKEIKKVTVTEPVKIKFEENTLLSIKRQNTQSDIQHVIARFKKSNNPTLSLFIAKKYYELKNYNQAYNYALITNEINNEIEESWIIFAKSLVKLDKKDKAIKMLQKYIANTHSQRAILLLNNIKSGKLI